MAASFNVHTNALQCTGATGKLCLLNGLLNFSQCEADVLRGVHKFLMDEKIVQPQVSILASLFILQSKYTKKYSRMEAVLCQTGETMPASNILLVSASGVPFACDDLDVVGDR